MVDLEIAIKELNSGKIEFKCSDDCCTTEGEVVVLLKRLAELEKATSNQWISVKERLPDKDTVVLVISKGGIMMTGRVRYNKKKDYYEAYFLCNYLGHITHWQPLPQPPTESEE